MIEISCLLPVGIVGLDDFAIPTAGPPVPLLQITGCIHF